MIRSSLVERFKPRCLWLWFANVTATLDCEGKTHGIPCRWLSLYIAVTENPANGIPQRPPFATFCSLKIQQIPHENPREWVSLSLRDPLSLALSLMYQWHVEGSPCAGRGTFSDTVLSKTRHLPKKHAFSDTCSRFGTKSDTSVRGGTPYFSHSRALADRLRSVEPA